MDYEKAFILFQKESSEGDVESQYMLGKFTLNSFLVIFLTSYRYNVSNWDRVFKE